MVRKLQTLILAGSRLSPMGCFVDAGHFVITVSPLIRYFWARNYAFLVAGLVCPVPRVPCSERGLVAFVLPSLRELPLAGFRGRGPGLSLG